MAKTSRPDTGERTGKQSRYGVSGAVVNFRSAFDAPDRSDYVIYRLMRRNPTIALARAIATAPMRVSRWSVKTREDAQREDPESPYRFISDTMMPLRRDIMRSMLWAMDYGWTPVEKVFELTRRVVRTGYGLIEYTRPRLVLSKWKALAVDHSKILLDDDGSFAGVRSHGVDVPANKAFVFANDAEPGNPYGRSRLENIRGVWDAYSGLFDKLGRYVTKVAGVVPLIEYPMGEGRDKSGAKRDNYDLATMLLNQLASGDGICMPNTYSPHADDLLRAGANLNEVKAWHIDFLQAEGSHGQEFIGMMEHFESLFMRGWLVPERVALEGRHGTLAETEAQADISLLVADDALDEMIDHVNRYVVDQLLRVNFGPEYQGTVWIEAEPLVDEERKIIRQIAVNALQGSTDLLLGIADLPAMLERLGVPHQQIATLESLREQISTGQAAQREIERKREEPPDDNDDFQRNVNRAS